MAQLFFERWIRFSSPFERCAMAAARRMLDALPSAHARGGDVRCFRCGCGCVCLQWHRSLVLHLDYGDLVRAMECLEDVLSEPPFGFSLGRDSFSACHCGDGWYYLLCRDRVVLRLSEDEARSLRGQLVAARAALEQDSTVPSRIM